MNIIKWFKNRQERKLAEERAKNDKLTAELTACRTSQEARFIKLRVNRDDIICIIGDIDDPHGWIGESIRKRFPQVGEVFILPAGTDIAVLTKTK